VSEYGYLTEQGKCVKIVVIGDSRKTPNRRSRRSGVGREGRSVAESLPQREPLKVAWESGS
jgi:hypothetical protein